ncbi:LacI family DNA-binding transcriptional regulator [Jannaschia aquimarina]|uniref:DegA protein n=1 Tax=Jannaschia aquimarina TaxID=935700 RepID=A0A0D1CJV5_9RHOB|nr:LacI family DNA-binding transcriptional regulator [Jannaschia aquimarina]KIT15022.1 HTH-type transcriptional regulator DegA [Jannaschia aquimarina]SNS62152.1 transcriptional regulator, LacI family [Jannaschia aquimarina]
MARPDDTGAKPTLNDVARAAGVSLATVDRVLNARAGVRPATIARVQNAIAELGYVRDTAAANLARRRLYEMAFLLPDTDNEFVAALRDAVAEQATGASVHRTRPTVVPVAPFDPQALADAVDALPASLDGVALFGPETPAVRDAVRRARERGIAVVALVSDLPSSERDHFVGIDNVRAGRTAGRLMGRFTRRSGRVVVLTGSRLARDHLERRQGFDQVMAEYPHLEVGASIEGRDDANRVAAMLARVLSEGNDVVGVYSSAAGNAGLIRALRTMPHDVTVIAHELTPTTRAALMDGTFDALIVQDAGHLVRSAIRLLRASADGAAFDPGQERIRIDIHLRENVPLSPEDTP